MRLSRFFVGTVFSIIGLVSNAGVTIHFQGRANDTSSVVHILNVACEAAIQRNWSCDRIAADQSIQDNPTNSMLRELNADGTAKHASGIIIRPNTQSEPLYLIFTESNQVKNFIKTQFGGKETHIDIINLFRKIQPLFLNLSIEDEGEYWTTSNTATLEKNINAVNLDIQKIKNEKPNTTGPVKIGGDRFIDVTITSQIKIDTLSVNWPLGYTINNNKQSDLTDPNGEIVLISNVTPNSIADALTMHDMMYEFAESSMQVLAEKAGQVIQPLKRTTLANNIVVFSTASQGKADYFFLQFLVIGKSSSAFFTIEGHDKADKRFEEFEPLFESITESAGS